MSLLHQAPIPSFSWDAQRIAAPAIDEVQALEFYGHLKILCRLGVRKKHVEESRLPGIPGIVFFKKEKVFSHKLKNNFSSLGRGHIPASTDGKPVLK